MELTALLLKLFLTFFACLTLAYLSMAISVGPWISPVIILICNYLLFKQQQTSLAKAKDKAQILGILQIAPLLAGLVCTAIGFILPALYFLDKQLFVNFSENINPLLLFISSITLVAMIWGAYWGNYFYQWVEKDSPPFLVPNFIAKIIKEISPATEAIFAKGSGLATLILVVRHLLNKYGFLPAGVTYYPSMIAIGFASGKSIILPFCVGFMLRYYILPKLPLLSSTIIPQTDPTDLISAIATGVILCSLLASIIAQLPSYLKKIRHILSNYQANSLLLYASKPTIGLFTILLISLGLWTLGKTLALSNMIILYAMVASTFLIAETTKFAAVVGIVPFGRFATTFMLPLLLLFAPNHLTLIGLCLFVAIASATAVAWLFNNKIGQLLEIPKHTTRLEFMLGIALTAIIAPLVFSVLLHNLTLGSAALFAQRGQARAMLVKSFSLDLKAICTGGAIFGFAKIIAISETIILSALLMPLSLSLSMLVGATLSLFIKHSAHNDFFFAGVFAGESIFVLGSLLFW